MAVWYLDNDDEITDAVARLRSTTDTQVVFVVSSGSRIATGRINFKLLAREAQSRDMAMAIASPDEQVRSLAMAAGVLALATADEAAAALARGDVAPEPAAPGEDELTGSVGGADDELAAARRRKRQRRLSIAVVFVLSLVLVGGVASLETLTSAEITLVPRVSTVGPISVTVAALTSIDEPDAAAMQIPAVAVPFPLSVEGAFDANGTETLSTVARGEVEFFSSEQSADQDIVAGTRVRTADGIEFQTIEAVVLPRPADGSGPARVTAAVQAIEAGPEANLPPGTITVVPLLASQGISVTNSEATRGGQLQEAPVVTQADYKAAADDLEGRLTSELEAKLRVPGSVPAGLTTFAESKQLGPVSFDPAEADVVGQVIDRFSLRGTADASVLAVDESLVQAVVASAPSDQTPGGLVIVPATIHAQTGEGAVEGERILFESTATGDAYAVIDAEAVITQITGLPVSEARAILDAMGTATVNVWPEFLGDLPNDGSRITLHVQDPSTAE